MDSGKATRPLEGIRQQDKQSPSRSSSFSSFRESSGASFEDDVSSATSLDSSSDEGGESDFIFRLEPMLGFCIVSRLIAIAFANDAFRRKFISIEEIFSLEVPSEREVP